MTREEREEWIQDMKEEAKQDELLTMKLTSDYEYFEDYYMEYFMDFRESYVKLKELHENNGWEFDISDIIY